MGRTFPSFTSSARRSEAGVTDVSLLIGEKFGWIFRRTHLEHDFGIDAYVDVVADDGSVTGQSLAMQIKSGRSYFQEETPTSFVYHGELKHLNYYINSPVPVVLIIHDPEKGLSLWELFDPVKTQKSPSGWKLEIPKQNVMTAATRQSFLNILGPAADHSEALESHWAISELLAGPEWIYYNVSRRAVEALDTVPIGEFFDRLRATDKLIRRTQGRIDVFISGYNDDPRELWEIPEVRAWFAAADSVVRDWFYFCDTRLGACLKTYMLCQCKPRRLKRGKIPRVSYDSKLMAAMLEKNWRRLNALTDRLGLPIEDNKRISCAILDLFEIPHGD